jgi:hypothetical protein
MSGKKKKPRTHGEHRRSNSLNQSKNENARQAWDDTFQVQGSIEGPISPVNYAGTQINIWGTPGGNLTDGLIHMADPNRNPQFGYMTEQMLNVINLPIRVLDEALFFSRSVCNRPDLHRSHRVSPISPMKRTFGNENRHRSVQATATGRRR